IRNDASRCAVWYHIQRSGITTVVRELISLENGNDQEQYVPLQPNPFRRMRNAFVGAVRFEQEWSLSSEFAVLFSEFLDKRKGVLKAGSMRPVVERSVLR
ncbi:hypothetical protein AAVH_40997, partial [Aphelenchoides avenae]